MLPQLQVRLGRDLRDGPEVWGYGRYCSTLDWHLSWTHGVLLGDLCGSHSLDFGSGCLVLRILKELLGSFDLVVRNELAHAVPLFRVAHCRAHDVPDEDFVGVGVGILQGLHLRPCICPTIEHLVVLFDGLRVTIE